MRKTVLCLIFLLLLALRISPAVTAQNVFTRVYVNGVLVNVFPVILKGIVYLPLYAMAQPLDASIKYDYKLNILTVNDMVISSYTQPDGQVLVPVEALCKTIGCTLEWDGQTRAIRITTPSGTKPYPAPTSQPTPTINPYISHAVPLPSPTPFLFPTPTPFFFPTETPAPTLLDPNTEIFVPVTARNAVFSVTVTNIETVNIIKEYYKPKDGYKFVTVYLSQKNVSDEMQIYSGHFSLKDRENNTYDYAEQLSNFWMIILKPGGINFGYLVFEIPQMARPERLDLNVFNQTSISLKI